MALPLAMREERKRERGGRREKERERTAWKRGSRSIGALSLSFSFFSLHSFLLDTKKKRRNKTATTMASNSPPQSTKRVSGRGQQQPEQQEQQQQEQQERPGAPAPPAGTATAPARAAAPIAPGRRGSSRFRGVSWYKEREKWMASLYIGEKKRRFLGCHDSEEDAAKAYDAEVRKRNLSTTLLNFPVEGEAPAPVARGSLKSSRFLGVSWHKAQRKWRARLYVHSERKDHFLGFFAAEEAAARARDDEVRRLNLPSVPLNFPAEGEAPGTEFDHLVSFAAAAAAALQKQRTKQQRRERQQRKRQRTPARSA